MTARGGASLCTQADPISGTQKEKLSLKPNGQSVILDLFYKEKHFGEEYTEHKLKWKNIQPLLILNYKQLHHQNVNKSTDFSALSPGIGSVSNLHDKWDAMPGIQLGNCILN